MCRVADLETDNAHLVAVIPIRAGHARRILLAQVVMAFAGRLFTHSLGESFSSVSSVNLEIWTVVGLLAAANALRFTLRASSIQSEHITPRWALTCWPASLWVPSTGPWSEPCHGTTSEFSVDRVHAR